jgi:hypothetical protein
MLQCLSAVCAACVDDCRKEEVLNPTVTDTANSGDATDRADLVAWANETAKSVGHTASISSVRDGSISSGVFFFHLLKAIEVGLFLSFLCSGSLAFAA